MGGILAQMVRKQRFDIPGKYACLFRKSGEE